MISRRVLRLRDKQRELLNRVNNDIHLAAVRFTLYTLADLEVFGGPPDVDRREAVRRGSAEVVYVCGDERTAVRRGGEGEVRERGAVDGWVPSARWVWV